MRTASFSQRSAMRSVADLRIGGADTVSSVMIDCGFTRDGAHNIPLSDVLAAKDDGRLPMEDHNTRLIVIGKDGLCECHFLRRRDR